MASTTEFQLSKSYRDLVGSFDRIVSIEMIEAVGHEFLPEYFSQISRLLLPDGAALIQESPCLTIDILNTSKKLIISAPVFFPEVVYLGIRHDKCRSKEFKPTPGWTS